MTKAEFKTAGQLRKATTFSDLDLVVLINCLERIIEYFEARGDANIILLPLRLELQMAERMKEARKNETTFA